MLIEYALHFLTRTLERCHLQCLVVDYDKPVDDRADKGLRRFLGVAFSQKSFSEVYPDLDTRTLYRATDSLSCRYMFMRVPSPDAPVLLIGPYLYADVTRQYIFETAEREGLSPTATRELELYYASLPVIREESIIFAMIHTFVEMIHGTSEDFPCVDVEWGQTTLPEILYFQQSEAKSGAVSIQVMESRYDGENELIDAVTCGNVHRAQAVLSHMSSLAFESRVSDKLRNMKNYCIIMNTLFRKAAERGGVHPVHLDRTSSDVAKRIESVASLSAIPELMNDVLHTYCRLVRRHSIKNFSPPVQRAIVMIDSDLTGDLSLKALSAISKVSPGYFSGLFKRETGKTLTEYVAEKRIRHAKHLLKTSSLQIQSIAQHCGILDLHYFSRLFKRVVGVTPSEYRSNPPLY